MKDNQAILDGICRIFESEDKDWLPAGLIAAHLTKNLSIKPPLTATRLKPIMDDMQIEMTTRTMGHRPTQGYLLEDCKLQKEAESIEFVPQTYPDSSYPDPQPQQIDRDILNVYAAEIIRWMRHLEPVWDDRIDALKAERGFNDLLTLISLAAWTLDQEAHMIVPAMDIFDHSSWHPDGSTCPECGKNYKESYPGQATCGDYHCGKSYNAKRNTITSPVEQVV